MAEITKKDIEVALQRPSDFGISSSHEHYEELFHTWALGPVIRTRDSNIMEQSNADALEKHLREDRPDLADEWMITQCNHWAVGWVDHLSFHAVNEAGEPTAMFHVLNDWEERLADYPLADEEDYSRRMYEGAVENIEQIGKIGEETAGKVFSWLWENDQRELEDRDGEPAYPSEEAVKKALKALGLAAPEEEGDGDAGSPGGLQDQ